MKNQDMFAWHKLFVGSSFWPLLGYSSSDMPVKAKRSALNYSLPITFNKAGELVYLDVCIYLTCRKQLLKQLNGMQT